MPRAYRSDEPLRVERPPHFRESPQERTQIYPPPDYPAAAQLEDRTDDPLVGPDETPLRVDIGQHIPQPAQQDWSSGRVTVDASRHVQLAGREPNRVRALVRNTGDTNSVFVGRNQTDPVYTMFEIASGAELEMWHQGPVWAVCASTESTTVSVIQEYTPAED